MTAPVLDQAHRQWALDNLGSATEPHITGLRDGGAPWLLEGRSSDGTSVRAVLRVGDPAGQSPQREAIGMRAAAADGLPVPRVVAESIHQGPDRQPLLLIEYLDGSSHQPRNPDPDRLHAVGAIAARIFAIEVADDQLPTVTHPIPSIDFDALRAQAAPDPLLTTAQARVAATVPDDPIGFTHGDLWSGNVLWRGAEIVGVLDWDGAGRGPAGVDLGSLRCDAAMCYGPDAPEMVLAGWQHEADRPADNVAYWDTIAALSTPPDIAWFAAAISGMTGRPDLTAEILRDRRDAFLADALTRLD